MRGDRLERLRRVLDDRGLDGAVISRPANVAYLSGAAGLELVVVGEADAVAVGPEGVVAAGGAAATYPVPGATIDRIADVPRLSAAALRDALGRAGLRGRRIGLEKASISALHAEAVAGAGDGVAVDGAVEALRRIKDAGELAAIRAAVTCNDAGFAAARDAIRPGVSELEVQEAVVHAMQAAAGAPVDVLPPTNGFVSGPRAEAAVGPATPRRLQPGDLMIIDVNPVIASYKGDTTRTFSVGPATNQRRRAHRALADGLRAAEAVARPGVAAREVYAALLGPIAEAGYGPDLAHHGGHALGLEHLERPFVIPGDGMLLEAGMVIALEPGVYRPGLGGMRLEEDYVVGAEGLEPLSGFPRELVVCPG